MDEALFKNRAIRFGALAEVVIHAMNNLMQDYADNKTLKQSMNEADYEHFRRSNLEVVRAAKRLLRYGDKSFNYFSKYQYTTVQVISDKNSIIRDLRLRDEAYMTLRNRRQQRPIPKYTPARKSHSHKIGLADALKVANEHGYKLMNSNVSNKTPFQPSSSEYRKENQDAKKMDDSDLFGAARAATNSSASSQSNKKVSNSSSSSDKSSLASSSVSNKASKSSSSISYHSSDPTMDDIVNGPVKSLGSKVYSDSTSAKVQSSESTSATSQSSESAEPSSDSSDSGTATTSHELNLDPNKSA